MFYDYSEHEALSLKTNPHLLQHQHSFTSSSFFQGEDWDANSPLRKLSASTVAHQPVKPDVSMKGQTLIAVMNPRWQIREPADIERITMRDVYQMEYSPVSALQDLVSVMWSHQSWAAQSQRDPSNWGHCRVTWQVLTPPAMKSRDWLI